MDIEALKVAIKDSSSLKQVVLKMNLSMKTKTYNKLKEIIAKEAISVNHFCRRVFINDIDDAIFIKIINESISLTEVSEKMKENHFRYNIDYIKENLKRLNLTTTHFSGRWNIPDQEAKFPLETRLVKNKFRGDSSLKRRLYKAGLLKKECNWCGITEWRGLPAPLELDHINGDPFDNTLVNLRILCPNCHAQTPTANGKNIGNSSRNRTDDAGC